MQKEQFIPGHALQPSCMHVRRLIDGLLSCRYMKPYSNRLAGWLAFLNQLVEVLVDLRIRPKSAQGLLVGLLASSSAFPQNIALISLRFAVPAMGIHIFGRFLVAFLLLRLEGGLEV